jgi:tetratricopeptide (TPR) repeat protein
MSSPQSVSRGNWNGGANGNRGAWTSNGNWNRSSWNSANWNRSNWAANNWNHGGHDHDFDHNNGWWWWGIAPLFGAYWGDWYPGYWADDYYGYPAYYVYDYSQPAYSVASQPNYTTSGTASGDQYLEQGVEAFRAGNYREAERLAGHAIVDNPRDAAAHQLISLAALGLGDYRAAAAEAHAVASLNGVPSWEQIYSFYGDVDRFTSQLRLLETFAREHPTDTPAQFLLGSLYLTTGYRADAKEHLLQVVNQMPKDRIAQQLLTEAGGPAPATAPPTKVPESLNPPNTSPANATQPPAVGAGK